MNQNLNVVDKINLIQQQQEEIIQVLQHLVNVATVTYEQNAQITQALASLQQPQQETMPTPASHGWDPDSTEDY